MPKVAIILVPGICASHLIDPVHHSIGWPLNSLNDMVKHVLYNSAEQAAIFEHGKDFLKNTQKHHLTNAQFEHGWGTVGLQVYEPFLKDCERTKILSFEPVVWAAGYNWWKSNWDSISDLQEVTRKALYIGDVYNFIYVTHSMGALIARAALKQDPQAFSHRCMGVVHVAAPNYGAPEAIMRLVRGFPDFQSQLAMGDKGWKVIACASEVPSYFELLPHALLKHDHQKLITQLQGIANDAFSPHKEPTPVHVSVAHQTNQSLIRLEQENWRKAQQRLNRILNNISQYVGQARDFVRNLDTFFFKRTGAVCLVGKNTVIDVDVELSSGNKLKEVQPRTSMQGDGTVPLLSQRVGVNPSFVRINKNGIDHADAFKEEGEKAGIFVDIYNLMNFLYRQYYVDGRN